MGNFARIQELKAEVRAADAEIKSELNNLNVKGAKNALTKRDAARRKLGREYKKNDHPHPNERTINEA